MNRIKNNNPGNIRVGDNWQGSIPGAGAFVNFSTLAYGFRAMFKLLQTYYKSHNLTTIRGIIERWAPPSDNNPTNSYITTIGSWSGINPEIPFPFDFNHLSRLAAAMTRFEHGIGSLSNEEENSLEQGYFMAFGPGSPGNNNNTFAGIGLIVIGVTLYLILS